MGIPLKPIGVIVMIALVELCLGYPVYALAPLLLHLPILLWLLPIPFAVFAGLGLGYMLAGRTRLWLGLSVLLLSFGAGLALWGTGLAGWVTGLAYLLAIARGAHAASTLMPDFPWLWGALIGYAVAAIVYANVNPLAEGLPALKAAGAATLVLALLLNNDATLRQASLPGVQRPTLTRSQLAINRVLTVAVLLVIFGLSRFSGLGTLIRKQLYAFLKWFFHLFHGATATPSVIPTPTPAPTLPQKVEHPWAFWIFLEKLMFAIGYVLAAILIVWLLWQIGLKVSRFAGQFLRFWLREQEGGAGFIDEQSSLGSWSSRLALIRRQHRRERDPAWETLSNRDKARFLYRLFQRSLARTGVQVEAAWTPRETGWAAKKAGSANESVSRIVDVYEQVRYGEREPDSRMIEELRGSLTAKPNRSRKS